MANAFEARFHRMPPMPGAAVAAGKLAYHPVQGWIDMPPVDFADDAGFYPQAGMPEDSSIRHVMPQIHYGVDDTPIMYVNHRVGQALVSATMRNAPLLPGRYLQRPEDLDRYRRMVTKQCKEMGDKAPHIAIIDKLPKSALSTLGDAMRAIEKWAVGMVGESCAAAICQAARAVLAHAIATGVDASTPIELPAGYYVQVYTQGTNSFAILGMDVYATSGDFRLREHTGDAVGVWVTKPEKQPAQFVVYHMRPVPVATVGAKTEMQLYHASPASVGYVGEEGRPVVHHPDNVPSSIHVWSPEDNAEGFGGVTIRHGDVMMEVPEPAAPS